MKRIASKILKGLIVVCPMAGLLVLATVGAQLSSVSPFVQTVDAEEYGSKEEEKKDDVPVITEEQQKEIDYRASTAGKVANDTTVSSVSIGNNVHSGGSKVGGGVSDVYNVTPLTQQVQATGANLNGGEIPYSKVSPEVGPVAKAALQQSAAAQGFIPGGVMNIEVGNFSTAGGYKPCDKLNMAANFDVYITPIAGYTPGVMMLLPDGTTRLLNANEFDTTRSGNVFGNNTRLYTIRTTVPNAVYMTVYMPAR